MKFLQRVGEGLKLYFFSDSIANDYMSSYGHYQKMVELFKDKSAMDNLKLKGLRSELVEQQKLLAKHGCEDFIYGLEIIEPGSDEYEKEIAPYLPQGTTGVARFKELMLNKA